MPLTVQLVSQSSLSDVKVGPIFTICVSVPVGSATSTLESVIVNCNVAAWLSIVVTERVRPAIAIACRKLSVFKLLRLG